ncbi:hypothetical protein GCM10010271_07470 [Streptomyces kurssanovii]|nr:hypothetical protein GCM10010271_07470 [Streptomyces kurssanovii]
MLKHRPRHPSGPERTGPHWLLRPDVLRGLAAVAEAGLAYDLVVLPHQLPAAAGAAAGVPGPTFVLDHLGKPPVASAPAELEPWARAVRAWRRTPTPSASSPVR